MAKLPGDAHDYEMKELYAYLKTVDEKHLVEYLKIKPVLAKVLYLRVRDGKPYQAIGADCGFGKERVRQYLSMVKRTMFAQGARRLWDSAFRQKNDREQKILTERRDAQLAEISRLVAANSRMLLNYKTNSPELEHFVPWEIRRVLYRGLNHNNLWFVFNCTMDDLLGIRGYGPVRAGKVMDTIEAFRKEFKGGRTHGHAINAQLAGSVQM